VDVVLEDLLLVAGLVLDNLCSQIEVPVAQVLQHAQHVPVFVIQPRERVFTVSVETRLGTC